MNRYLLVSPKVETRSFAPVLGSDFVKLKFMRAVLVIITG